jgi:hypothetical protein
VKILIWAIAAVIALAWTGTIVVSALATTWAADLIESGRAIDWAREAARLPIPRWFGIWVDPDILRSLQEAVMWSVEAAQAALPIAAALLDWLVPLAWAVWGIGMLTVIGLAGGLHWLVTRSMAARAV